MTLFPRFLKFKGHPQTEHDTNYCFRFREMYSNDKAVFQKCGSDWAVMVYIIKGKFIVCENNKDNRSAHYNGTELEKLTLEDLKREDKYLEK